MAQYLARSTSGKAVFSTRNGKYAQREATPNMSIVIRSDPAEDRDTMTARLMAEFPTICKAITTFSPNVSDYFDGHDQELQGFEFLRAVLLHIAAINTAQARKVLNYVGRWMATNAEAFALFTPEHTLEHLFTKGDIDEYGEHFLRDVTVQIKSLKYQAGRSEVAHESDALRQQPERMASEPGNLIHAQTSSYASPSGNLRVVQPQQAMSNPGSKQNYSAQSFVRAMLPSQFTNQQGRYAQQNLRPSTGALEQAYTGSFNQRNVRANPVYVAAGTYPSSTTDCSMVVLSQDLPVLHTYKPQPRAPVTDRHRNYSDIKPRGKKNPVKRSSDDARKGSFDAGSRRQSFSRRRYSQVGTFPMVQSPQTMLPTLQIPVHQSVPLSQPYTSMSGPVLESQHQLNISEARHAIIQNTVPYTRDTAYAGHQLVGAKNEHPPSRYLVSVPDQASEPTGQSSCLHVPGHQIANSQTSHSNVQSTDLNIKVSPPAVKGNQGQAQFPQNPLNQETPRRDVEFIKGYRIWIGGLPTDSSKENVLQLLEPFRGLLDILGPRNSLKQTYHQPYCGHVFADFESQHAAEEALARIPRFRFPSLPEGRFLSADWPLKRDSTPSHQHQHPKIKVISRQEMPQVSPTKVGRANDMEGPNVRGAVRVSTHSRKKSGVNAAKEALLPSTRGNVDVAGPYATRVQPVDPTNAHPSLHPPERVQSSSLLTENEVPAQVEPVSSFAEPLDFYQGLSEVGTVPAGQDFKSGETTSSSKPFEPRTYKEALTQATKANNDPFAVDGTSDAVPTKNAEQKAQHMNNKQCSGDVAPKSRAKRTNKIIKIQSQKHQSKLSNASQKSDGGASSGSQPKSENVKPQAKAPAQKIFLEKAAFDSKHEDDAPGIHGAETQAPEPSAAATTNITTRATSNHEVQLVLDPSTIAVDDEEARDPMTIERVPPSIGDLSSPTRHQGKPSHDARPITRQYEPDLLPRASALAIPEATISDTITSDTTVNEGDTHEPQAMTRDASNSILDNEDTPSFEHCSTMQTSYVQTERSNSIADASQPIIVDSNKSYMKQHVQSGEIDIEKLHTLLQADAAARQDDGHFIDKTAKQVSAHSRQGNDKVLNPLEPDQELVHEETYVRQTQELPRSATRTESVKEEANAISSCGATDTIIEPGSVETALPLTPDTSVGPVPESTLSQGPLSGLQHGQSKSPENKLQPGVPPRSSSLRVVSEPIQTRHKKKPKQFKPVEDGNDSVLLSRVDEKADDRSLDPEATLATADLQRSPPSVQAQWLKKRNKKKASKNKNKKAQKIPGLELMESLQTAPLVMKNSLPKPETPFQVDGGVSSPDCPNQKPMRQPHNKDRSLDLEEDSSKMELLSSVPFHDSSYESAITPEPTKLSADHLEGFRAALEEAGYQLGHKHSSADYFTIRDPYLVRLEVLMDMEKQSNEGQESDDADSRGELLDQIKRIKQQFEVNQIIIDTAKASRKNQEVSPPHTPTRDSHGKQKTIEDVSPIILLEGEIEKIAAHLISDKVMRGEQEIGELARDRKIEKAKDLLDLSPRRNPSKTDAKEWAKMVTEYVEENTVTPYSAPSTPSRKSKNSNVRHPNSSPGTPLRGRERINRGSATVLDRPGSTILARPGSATAIVKLRPGEDSSKIATECCADPNAFFGYGETADSKSAPFLGSSDPASSESEKILTPPSPQTVGRRTPSQERRKRIPLSPSLRQSRQSAKNLASTFATMRATASSALDITSTTKLNPVDLQKGSPVQSEIGQREALGKNIVGYWKENSGGKDSEIQPAHGENHEDAGKWYGKQNKGDHETRVDLHAFQTSLSEAEKMSDENNFEEKSIDTTYLTKQDGQEIPPDANSVTIPDGPNICTKKPSEKKGGVRDDDKTTNEINDESSNPIDETAVVLRVPGNQIPQPADQDSQSPKSSLKTPSEDSYDIDFPTPKTFAFGSETSSFAREDQDDAEYPVLPRGGSLSTKGGKSRSPTRGGYAAAAKKKVAATEEKQERKQEGKSKCSDGWAVAASEAWGIGRGDGKRTQKPET